MDFPDDIPKRDVDAGHCGRTYDSAAVPEVLSPHDLPQMLDSRGVFADQQLRQIFDRAHNTARVPFQSRFAPADEARLIGNHFDEDPVSHSSMTDKRFDGCDLHDVP